MKSKIIQVLIPILLTIGTLSLGLSVVYADVSIDGVTIGKWPELFGNRIDILDGPDYVELPADEPCHILHGWYRENASTLTKEEIKTFVSNKVMFLYGLDLNLTRMNLNYHYNSTSDILDKLYYVQYPADHFVGEHIFTGVWLDLDSKIIWGRTITVNFISSREVTPQQTDSRGIF